MTGNQSVVGSGAGDGMLVLGVDTCGAEGSVALARIVGGEVRIKGQVKLAGRSYSATLVSAVGELLERERVKLADLGAVVVVNGPGSFTGVRVGVSAVKGLAEPGQIPVVAVSRLAVLAAKAGVEAAALDAHRHEVFLLAAGVDGSSRELLAGAEEISQVSEARPGAPRVAGVQEISQVSEARPLDGTGVIEVSSPVSRGEGPGAPNAIAVCEEAAEVLLRAAWPGVKLVRVEAPTAADAIRLCVPAILAGEFADLAALDGHYLRRSDAEIFGDAAQRA